jgi:hypothetical protein
MVDMKRAARSDSGFLMASSGYTGVVITVKTK